MNIVEVMQDPVIFGEQFAGETWWNVGLPGSSLTKTILLVATSLFEHSAAPL